MSDHVVVPFKNVADGDQRKLRLNKRISFHRIAVEHAIGQYFNFVRIESLSETNIDKTR